MFAWNWSGASRTHGSSRPGRESTGDRPGAGHTAWHWVVVVLLALLVWALPGVAHAQATVRAAEPSGSNGPDGATSAAAPAVMSVAAGQAAAPALTVEFIEPRRYVDAGDRIAGQADPDVLALIQRQLEKSAAQCLPPGQTLRIRVLDVDLAGDVDMSRRRFGESIRVLRDRAWPRIDLAYTLTRGGLAGTELREQVSDSNYLMRLGVGRYDDARLPHERAMLARWFEASFCPHAAH
jgi:hypothetical protein